MSFVKATVNLYPDQGRTGVSCAMQNHGKQWPVRLSFTIREDVGKEMNIGDGDKIEVLIGQGEHQGFIRIRKNNSIGVVAAKSRDMGGRKYFHLRLGHQRQFVDRAEASQPCQWAKVEEGWFELVLPAWSRETKSAAGPASGQRPQVVTGQLMGDPPAGRQEMLERIGKIR